jgi:hypothetical protein
MADSNTSSKTLDPSMAKLLVGIVTVIVIGWATSITRTVSTVTGLEPQIEQIQVTQERNSKWIAEWPTTGRLSTDVSQDKEIVFLKAQIKEQKEDLADKESRIRALEREGN